MTPAAPLLEDPPPIRLDAFVAWPERGAVEVDGVLVSLTPREMQVLLVLARQPGRVVQREAVYDAVWGGAMAYRDRSVDVWVRKLRRKLSTAAPRYRFVHTHYGFGYRFQPELV